MNRNAKLFLFLLTSCALTGYAAHCDTGVVFTGHFRGLNSEAHSGPGSFG